MFYMETPAYYSYSNHTNNQIQTIQADATALLGWFNTEKLDSADARTAIVTSVTTEQTRAEGEEARIEAKIDAAETRLDGIDAGLQARVDEIFNDEFVATSSSTVTAQLESADSALSTALAAAITNREAKDTLHEAQLDKSNANDEKLKDVLVSVCAYLDKFFVGTSVYDSNDNLITPPDWSAIATSLNSLEDHESA
jgi:hypothetical protein